MMDNQDIFNRGAFKHGCTAAGLMSGTSMDGVDAIIIDIWEKEENSNDVNHPRKVLSVKKHAFNCRAYPLHLKERLMNLAEGGLEGGCAREISHLKRRLGKFYWNCLEELMSKTDIDSEDVDLVGSHGQTVYHSPGESVHTLQLDCPSILVENSGIPAVSNFRQRDIAAGGEGAPLVPLIDYLLYRREDRHRFMLNIGGIANYTFLPAACSRSGVRGSDTGPGNMLIDAAVRRITGGVRDFDPGGEMAAGGRVSEEGIKYLFSHDFFQRPLSRSTGRSDFDSKFLNEFWKFSRRNSLSEEDILATLTAFTARSAAKAVTQQFKKYIDREGNPVGCGNEDCRDDKRDEISRVKKKESSIKSEIEVIVSGGGIHNRELMRKLESEVDEACGPPVEVLKFAEAKEKHRGEFPPLGADEKEAAAFAMLAWLTSRGESGNLPAVTGAEREVVLGNITPVDS